MPAPGHEWAHSKIFRKSKNIAISDLGLLEQIGPRGDVGKNVQSACLPASVPAFLRQLQTASGQIMGLVEPAGHDTRLPQGGEEQR